MILRSLAQLFRGPQGPPGIVGPRGKEGLPGPTGRAGPPLDLDNQLIRLPLGVTLLAPDDNVAWLPHVDGALAESKRFWAALGIDLRVTFKVVVASLPDAEDIVEARRFHRWQGSGFEPSLYIFGMASRIGGKYLGLAYVEHGFALLAGNVLLPGGESQLNEIVDHELGHLLGLDHQDGTFMRAELELRDRLVTPEQRATLRAAAYRLGGL